MTRRRPVGPLHTDTDARIVGRKAEKRTARRLGAILHAASGSLDRKADMSLRHGVTLENKSTQGSSMRVQLDWLLGVWAAAREQGNTPALGVQFTLANGEPRPRGRWVMIPEDVFLDMLSMLDVDRPNK